MATTNLGTVAVHGEGEWNPSTEYTKLAIVGNNGGSYMARRAVPAGTALTDMSYWMPISDTRETLLEALEQHPEWVTTVADGSITEDKLSAALAAVISDNTAGIASTEIRVDSVETATAQHGTSIRSIDARVTQIETGASPQEGELLGIRVAYDGTTYDSAGDAVRATGEKTYDHITRLPPGYQQIEYVEVGGSQYYIGGHNTKASNKTKISCKFQLTDLDTNNYIFGSRRTSSVLGFWASGYASGEWRFGFGSQNKGYGNADLGVHTIDFDRETVRLDGAVAVTFNSETFESPKVPRVGAIIGAPSSTTTYYPGRAKIFSFAMWEDGVAIADLIPAVRTSDGAVGFYNTVLRYFVESESGENGILGSPFSLAEAYRRVEAERIKIVELDNAIAFPAYVAAEADRVADAVRNLQGGKTLTFAAISDLHYNVDNASTQQAVREMGMAIKAIAKQTKIDFYACFGDIIYRLSSDGNGDYDKGLAEAISASKIIGDAFGNAPQFRLVGNHDPNAEAATGYFAPGQMYAFAGIHSDPLVRDAADPGGGYGYRDFERQKIRIVVLNTSWYDDHPSQGSTQYNMENAQGHWLCAALDLSDKADAADWQIMLFSHVTFDSTAHARIGRFTRIIQAYENGGTVRMPGESAIAYNYAGKNAAKIVLAVNGHAHRYSFANLNIIKASGSDWVKDYASRVARAEVPNVLNGREEASINGVTYAKTAGTKDSTAFQIVTIDPDTMTAYFTHYGAGIDMIIHYGQTAVDSAIDLTTQVASPVWNTQDAAIATVAEGIVTAVASGNTMVYAAGESTIEAWNIRVGWTA